MSAADPIQRFRALLAAAAAVPRERLAEPTAFCLATADTEGRPSARMLLLKDVDERGFVFYTNYESRKGRELLARPWAALCFHWQPLEVQVRVEGPVAVVDPGEADAYFASRARGSQISAWASRQSRPLAAPEELEARVGEFTRRFDGGPVPRPPHWSGFRLAPARIEFWKNMPSRLHDRDLYERDGAEWRVEKLHP
ncbi:MAG TPA: pyridoxamine 5'-phosphate oxidase [Gemmatimonadaceae bacterium]|nr:pyridoxamine 5'-phosphate oxidase [Gemmatimonadaceae bacterium]